MRGAHGGPIYRRFLIRFRWRNLLTGASGVLFVPDGGVHQLEHITAEEFKHVTAQRARGCEIPRWSPSGADPAPAGMAPDFICV